MGTLLGCTACSLRGWSHPGVPTFCIGMLHLCANLWHQSHTCSTCSSSCTTLFCLYPSRVGPVVLAAFLPEHMGSTEYLWHIVWAPVDCLFPGIVVCYVWVEGYKEATVVFDCRVYGRRQLVGGKTVTVRLIVLLVPWIIHKNGVGCRWRAKKDPIHGVGLGLRTWGATVLFMMEVTEGEERKPSFLIWAFTMNKHDRQG